MMNKIPFTLDDIEPKEVSLTVSGHPHELHLEPWSLYVRSWAVDRFTSDGLKLILEKQQVREIAELAHFMLKEKATLSHTDFLKAIRTPKDQLQVIMALLGAIGLGEPHIQEIRDAMNALEAKKKDPKPKPQSKEKKIGAKSSTRSQAATRGVLPKDSSD